MIAADPRTTTVEETLDVLLTERGFSSDALAGFAILFRRLDIYSEKEAWEGLMKTADSRGLTSVTPSFSHWIPLIASQLRKLVSVLYVDRRAIGADGFSTDLATSLLKSLSVCSSQVVEKFFTPADQVSDAFRAVVAHEKTFWLVLYATVIFIYFYDSQQKAFDAIVQLVSIRTDFLDGWEDMLKLLDYFSPQKPRSTDIIERLAQLVEGVESRGYRIRVREESAGGGWTTFPQFAAEFQRSAVKKDEWESVEVSISCVRLNPVDVAAQGSDAPVAAEEEEGVSVGDVTAKQGIEMIACHLVDVAKQIRRSLKKTKTVEMVTMDGSSFHAEALRFAMNELIDITRNKTHLVSGADGSSSSHVNSHYEDLEHQMLMNDGWISFAAVSRVVEAKVQAYKMGFSLVNFPTWILEVVKHHDLFERLEVKETEGKYYVRATHSHAGRELGQLYERILRDPEDKLEVVANEGDDAEKDGADSGSRNVVGEQHSLWLYVSTEKEKALDHLIKKKCYPSHMRPAPRFLTADCVSRCQEYSKLPLDQRVCKDFKQSFVFLEVNTKQLNSYYALFKREKSSVVFAFSSITKAVPLTCFTGKLWASGEESPSFADFIDPLQAPPPHVDNTFLTVSAPNPIEQDPDAEAWREIEEPLLEAVNAFIRNRSERSTTITVPKGSRIMVNRDRKFRQFKTKLLTCGLLYTEEKTTTANVLTISKPATVPPDTCHMLANSLHFPDDFDISILKRATTSSNKATENYEELEFIGDAVLGYMVAIEKFVQVADDSSLRCTDDLDVVGVVCSNDVLMELLPKALLEIYQDRKDKVKADIVEAIIGAAFEGQCTFETIRGIIHSLYQALPGAELSPTMEKAWRLNPYQQPNQLDSSTFRFEAVNVLRLSQRRSVLPSSSSTGAGKNAHGAMIGFGRIDLKTRATHFTSAEDLYCYRRIYDEEFPLLRNRILLGAELGGDITYVNEVITDIARFVIDFDGESVFSYNFLRYLSEWAAKEAKTAPQAGRFIVASCSNEAKESYHIHFPDFAVNMKNPMGDEKACHTHSPDDSEGRVTSTYTGYVEDLINFVTRQRANFQQRLRSSMEKAREVCTLEVITGAISESDGTFHPMLKFCDYDSLCSLAEAEPLLRSSIASSVKGLPVRGAAKLFMVPDENIYLGAVRNGFTTYAVIEVREVLGKPQPAGRWLIGADLLKDLSSFLFQNVTVANAVSKSSTVLPAFKLTALDCGLTESRKLRMMLCDKFKEKGPADRPVFPTLLHTVSASDGLSGGVGRLVPILSSRQPSEVRSAIVKAARLPPSSQPFTADHYGDDDEEWDTTFSPESLRHASGGLQNEPTWQMASMDAVTVNCLRDRIVRDVNGDPYSLLSNALALQESGGLFDDTINLASWKQPYDGIASQDKKTTATMTTWVNMCSIDTCGLLPGPYQYITNESEKKRATDYLSTAAKVRAVLESALVRDTYTNEVSFLVRSEEVFRTSAAVSERKSHGAQLLEGLLAIFTPTYVMEMDDFEARFQYPRITALTEAKMPSLLKVELRPRAKLSSVTEAVTSVRVTFARHTPFAPTAVTAPYDNSSRFLVVVDDYIQEREDVATMLRNTTAAVRLLSDLRPSLSSSTPHNFQVILFLLPLAEQTKPLDSSEEAVVRHIRRTASVSADTSRIVSVQFLYVAAY